MATDYTSVLLDGPWTHTFVPANGARFHVAVAGPDDPEAPLVLLMHGFPQMWWAWRDQIPALAAAGYRVAAMDLRGVGASDKPPLGYDVPTRTRDAAGVIRALGADTAVVVGHGLGATVAWAMPTLQPNVTRGVVALSAPHPAHLHHPSRDRYTRSAWARLALFQLPALPERALAGRGLVARVLMDWSRRPFAPDVLDTYENAMTVPFASRGFAEALRWVLRSRARLDGRRFLSGVRRPVTVPVLQLHGGADPVAPLAGVDLDGAALCQNYRFEVLPDVGHFLPEEAPDEVTSHLLAFLGRVTGA